MIQLISSLGNSSKMVQQIIKNSDFQNKTRKHACSKTKANATYISICDGFLGFPASGVMQHVKNNTDF